MIGLRRSSSIIIFLALFLLASPATGHAALPQAADDEAVESVDSLCKQLTSLYKAKKDMDVQRIMNLVRMLHGRYKTAKPAEQKKIVKAIRKAYDIKRLPKDLSFLITASGALADMGKEGKDALLHGLNHKNFKVRPSKEKSKEKPIETEIRKVKVTIVEAIGFTKQVSAIKPLSELLWDDDWEIIRASCKALSCFADSRLKVRKPVVKELVKVFANINALSLANPKRTDYRDKLNQLEVPFSEALRALTPANFDTAEEWEKWYNNNKNKPKW